MMYRFLTFALMLVCLTCRLWTQPVVADEPVDYLKQIKPLLQTKCYSCHGVLKQEANLRLETRALMLQGGDSGAAVVPAKVDESLILERITGDEFTRMPPADEGASLKPKEIALIKRWIAEGAAAPDEEIPLAPTEHWAFQRIEKPLLPEPFRNDDSIHPVDAFLAAKRLELGLKTQPQAERSILIRRLYLDLVGLPPTLEQLHDERPWPLIVDELLSSPQYGERWGRHWMDIWRYTDWYGLGAQLRNSQKHIWHWRDWIVNSLNADKGYDRMIQEMLAGDELAPNDPEAIAGTGFLARNYYLFNRTTWLDSTIEHTGKAFLGLTLNCAKCHDHKYDPITQVDYYNFRAIFEPHQVRLDPVPGITDFEKDGLPRVFDDHIDEPTYLHRRGDPQNPDKDTKIEPRVPELFADFQPEVQPVSLPAEAYAPAVRDYVQQDRLQAARNEIATAENELAKAQQTLVAWKKEQLEKPEPAATEKQPFDFSDSFDKPNPEAWELVGDSWEYHAGTLRRTTSTREKEVIRFKQPMPHDFEVTCRYTTTGGTTYKSVTFRFDEADDGQYENFVYSSAYAAGSKIQVAMTRHGKNTYPSDGAIRKDVEVGKSYELKFAVRDRLVNVWWDREFVLAYQLPDRCPEGTLSLSGFDATVAFDSIRIRSLPVGVKLTAAGNKGTASPQDPEQQVKLAEAKVILATARLKSLQATIAADKARYLPPSSESVDELTQQAASAQAERLLVEAEYEKLAAGADANKQKAAENKRKQAQQKLDAAKKGAGTYASLRASFKALETPAHKEPDYPPVYSPVSTGRRLSLARWMTSRDNPLTARVAVNHVWLRHFGEPLVESVSDFGLRAKTPEYRELLDYLAAEFMESGWSFKHLHRLIVTSEAYRLSSSTLDADSETLARDPNNHFYWRMNTRRMESQIIRDCLLQLAGRLDLTMGGPSLDVGNKSNRRSIYFKHSRDAQDKFLTMFDDADLLQCYRRSESIVPQQALALSNSELSLSTAAQIAQQISERHPEVNRNQFTAIAFELLLGRKANEAELAECDRYSRELQELLEKSDQLSDEQLESRVRVRLVHSLFNHNDFITIR
ncbi:MAG: DUF1553 domain-containing protein [Planctomycetaceae bacterium]|nr:DUF1553 domain-containing protein [Planctomycetaceae bacterium]